MRWHWCRCRHHSLLSQLPSLLTALVPLSKSLPFLQPSPPPDDYDVCCLLNKYYSLLQSPLVALAPSPKPLLFLEPSSPPDDCCVYDKQIDNYRSCHPAHWDYCQNCRCFNNWRCRRLIVAFVALLLLKTRRGCMLSQSLQPSLPPNNCCFCWFFDKNLLFVVADAIAGVSTGIIAKATDVSTTVIAAGQLLFLIQQNIVCCSSHYHYFAANDPPDDCCFFETFFLCYSRRVFAVNSAVHPHCSKSVTACATLSNSLPTLPQNVAVAASCLLLLHIFLHFSYWLF